MSRTKVAVRVSERTLEHIGQAARRQRELLSPEELQERADALSQEVVAAGEHRVPNHQRSTAERAEDQED